VKSAQTRWLDWIFSTNPANREQAEEGVRYTYRAAGVPEPKIFLWCDDLMEALLVTEQLSGYDESNWMLPPESLQRREELQRRIRHQLGLRAWKQVRRVIGPKQSQNRYESKQHLGIGFMVAVPREDGLQAVLRSAQYDPPCDYEVIEEAAAVVGRRAITSHYELVRIIERAAGPGVPGHFGIGHLPPIYDDYRWALLFRHDCLLSICGDQASAVYDGLCRTVQHCGPWWAFANAAVLCDRPREARRDSEGRLHSDIGPAVSSRNGLELFAWHGSWIPPEAIRHPESLKASAIRAEEDPKVRQALIEIYGMEQYESERRPVAHRKPRNPLQVALPEGAEKKIEVLRGYGHLPYYERYLAGEHRQVWQELGAIGARVREDQYAADALAVAYATMDRVRQNIATIIQRLREIGYEFETDLGETDKVIPFDVARWNLWLNNTPERPAPLMPPEQRSAHLRRLERDAGALPLSLRAWYEIVGSVTLAGKHPILSPGDGTLLADPLVIVPFSQVLRAWDASPPEVGIEGRPFVAEVAPAAICQTQPGNRSYSITLPCVGMDALLENERHGLFFIDYLRLALEWGGFPGFESAGRRPQEIEFLSQGNLTF